ncbi:agmatine deiminase family protein, partial [Pseudomonas sp. MPR-AND1A]|uniref:agmatine deiminase family protein n=2 Tax=Pseudomonadota TaxID=1224 RepID=UPI000CBE9A16
DGDGTGLVVTTEQCLLNPNRNPSLTKSEIEQRLRDDLGLVDVLWLGDGLMHDHTDGHVDNLARFVAPGVLVIPEAAENDPNWLVYQRAAQAAAAKD